MPSPRNDSGLSVRTLAIASAASLTSAIVVREIWGPGAIIGAAMTPVIVALVSESLKRPTERISTIASQRRDRTRIHEQGPQSTQLEPPPFVPDEGFADEDRFGIWADAEPRRRRLDSKHVRIAIATGLAAFVLVVVALTASELVFGGSVTGGSKTTVFGGSKSKKKSSTSTQTTSTQPASTGATTPEETPSETQTQTTPTETTPTAPAETTPTSPTTPVAPETTASPGGAEAPAP